ncbi:tyrosine-protein phosphatase [Cellvibrio sp. NN19]|uniref:tyrosine-protein phosphatase n=1 Tax=Cellvibrio chitinivorans TaxID=3102792 RepID=UPI002B40CA78|nr:tyrosine-protein phosphatase [Cellvibrio sp. NN19]
MRFSIKSTPLNPIHCAAAAVLSLMIALPVSAAATAEAAPVAATQTAAQTTAQSTTQATTQTTTALTPQQLLSSPLDQTYERLLPLQGGSNFRDLGGYKTADNKTVKRGLLFRSGAMSSLTSRDETYLARFNFDTVMDLRSTDERDLYPDYWAKNAKLNYEFVDYSMMDMMKGTAAGKDPRQFRMDDMYRGMPLHMKPQLAMYFDNLVKGNAPIVVHCSAGQDRTGIASALLLTALGVPREQIYKDYLLSMEYRRPLIEMGDVDLAVAAKTNTFAAMMLQYKGKMDMTKGNPLVMPDNTPFLQYAFEAIDAKYGSVENYLDKEIGVSERDIKRLKKLYLN